MTSEAQELLEKARRLPPIERAELLERLFATFHVQQHDQIDEAWAAEAEDRLSAYRSGKIKAEEVYEVFDRINRSE